MDIRELLVVMVEPSGVQQRIISDLFHSVGVTNLINTKNGTEALEVIRKEDPDLVVSALYLPDMSGTDLVHTMRDDPDMQGKAFMLISSETSFRALDPVRQAGTVAILPKPFDKLHLARALLTTLEYIDPKEASLGEFEVESLHVLVVDDSRLARRHIRRVLENMGIEHFVEAENGKEAIDKLSEGYFDLVVTDYNMPEMDGDQLTHYIRERSSQQSIPILMVTSEEDEGRLAAVQQAGVSAVCDKPFEPQSVRVLIEGMFS